MERQHSESIESNQTGIQAELTEVNQQNTTNNAYNAYMEAIEDGGMIAELNANTESNTFSSFDDGSR